MEYLEQPQFTAVIKPPINPLPPTTQETKRAGDTKCTLGVSADCTQNMICESIQNISPDAANIGVVLASRHCQGLLHQHNLQFICIPLHPI